MLLLSRPNGMSARIIRFFALVFVVLVTSPLTAPFRSCDFSHLIDPPSQAISLGAVNVEPDDAVAEVASFVAFVPAFHFEGDAHIPAAERPSCLIPLLSVLRI